MATITLKLGDSFEIVPTLKDVGAVVCDPPYLLSFMGKQWDSVKGENVDWFAKWLKHCFDILPSGGVVKVFSATRTFHRLAQAMERVGFTSLGLEAWVYGCLSEDTEILTVDGWKPGISVEVGMKVVCWDPSTGKTVQKAIEGVISAPFEGEMVAFKSRLTDQLLTPNHRVYHRPIGDDVTVSEARSLLGQQVLLHIKTRWGIGYARASGEAMPYKGTVWCVNVPTGAFVARRNGLIFITGNSGFPKSLDLSKAVDRHLGKSSEREVVGHAGNKNPQVVHRNALNYGGGAGKAKNGLRDGHPITVPASSEARRFGGWGTALKPAWEPFIVGVKP